MNDRSDNERALRELMERALRDLPPRRAPVDLEARVLNEVERRAARPWWRQSFGHWPRLARAGFVAVCALLIAGVMVGGHWTDNAVSSLHTSSAVPLPLIRGILTLGSAAAELMTLFAKVIPSTWMYTALATSALLYTVLFGLGAAAYRTLYLTPSDGR
jgi:hypothetical protein